MDIFSKLYDAFATLKSTQLKIFIGIFVFTTFIDVALLDFIPNLKLLPSIAFAFVFNIIVLLIVILFTFLFLTLDDKEQYAEWQNHKTISKKKDRIFIMSISIVSLLFIVSIGLTTYFVGSFLNKENNKEFMFITNNIKSTGILFAGMFALFFLKMLWSALKLSFSKK